MITRLVDASRDALVRRFVYFPDTRRPNAAAVGLPGVIVGQVKTDDGLSLLTWWAPPGSPDDPVVLYLHGNAGNVGYRADRLRRLNAAGFGVLLLEYRGFGGNRGTPSEAGLWLDTQAGLAALRTGGVGSDRLVIWGESLGTALAVRAAAAQPVAALLLEAPYTSLADIGRAHGLGPVARLVLDGVFDTMARIGKVTAPVLVMAGERDRLIPIALSRAVYEAAPDPKLFWAAPAGAHNTLAEAGAIDVAVDFVRRRGLVQPGVH